MNASLEYGQRDLFVIDAELDERVAFIRRTYAHVGGATAFFIGLVALFINVEQIAIPLSQFAFANWWMILVAFFIASFAAHRMAESGASVGVQYAGLGLYAFAEALIFTPILYLLHSVGPGGDDLIVQAGLLTTMIFGGLTLFVLMTKSDFSFLRNFLAVCSFAVMGLIVVSLFTSLSLGTWFAMGMVLLMSGFILYETSNVLHHYRTDQHVSAALAIFSSLATLFWYVLQVVSAFNND